MKVLHNQTILDIAVQHTGNVENCFQIAIANGNSVSDMLSAGTNIKESQNANIDTDMVNFFKAKKINPATAETTLLETPQIRGIGHMRIGQNFKIS